MAETRTKISRGEFFPTLIYSAGFEDAAALNATLLARARALRDADPERLSASTVGGWRSRADLHVGDEDFGALARRLLVMAEAVFRDAGLHGQTQPAMVEMWATIDPPRVRRPPHVNPGALWSGAYHVAAPEGAGRIVFSDPRPARMMEARRIDPEARALPANAVTAAFDPVPGRALIFPSWLMHEVEENAAPGEGSAAERVCVSFNIRQELRRSASA